MATRRFPEPSYMFTLVDRGADLLLAAGRIGLGWRKRSRQKRDAARRFNHFYGLIVFASAVARKPTSMGTRS